MKHIAILKAIENFYNFSSKIFSKPKRISIHFKKNEDKYTIILFFLLLLTITFYTAHNSFTQDLLLIKVMFSIFAIVSTYYSILTIGNIIICYNLKFPFELNQYTYRILNNEITEVNQPSKLLKKLRQNSSEFNKLSSQKRGSQTSALFAVKRINSQRDIEVKTLDPSIQNKNSNTKDNDNKQSFNNSKNNTHINIAVDNKFLIINNFRFENSFHEKKQKHSNPSENEKTSAILRETENQNQYSENEINYNNRPENKPGRGGIRYKYFAVKYFIIQHFYPEERIFTRKYKSGPDFYNKIGLIEDINPGSFKNQFSKIRNEQKVESVADDNKKILQKLNENNEFNDFPLAKQYVVFYLNT